MVHLRTPAKLCVWKNEESPEFAGQWFWAPRVQLSHRFHVASAEASKTHLCVRRVWS